MRDSSLILWFFLAVGILGYAWFWFVIEWEEEQELAEKDDCYERGVLRKSVLSPDADSAVLGGGEFSRAGTFLGHASTKVCS